MTDPAVRVERLGKKYRIGERQPYKSLRESITRAVSGRLRGDGRAPRETIWALRDVSFEVARGEVIGVIGRNGAGKSTLLKVLARITDPTEGRAEVHGRVGSLLEVGTGFHMELTGRENIYLNGAILGMKRAEIQSKFDEIVAFAEIDQFLDTPVKRFSTGMYLRLAFAVAAHLEPEILLVDEVLAVGDAAFQRKCLGKMGDVASQGRTVLFVSHNIAAMTRLCGRCLWIAKGHVRAIGPQVEIIAGYLAEGTAVAGGISPGEWDLAEHANPYPPHKALIRRVRLRDTKSLTRQTFQMGEPMTVEIEVDGLNVYRDGTLGVIFKSQEDQWLAGINTAMRPFKANAPRNYSEVFLLHLPRVPFTPGTYWIDLSASRGQLGRVDFVDRAARLVIEPGDVYGTGYTVSSSYGVFFLDGSWEVEAR